MPSDQEHGILEIQGVVEIVVVDNDTTAEDDPYGDDSGCTELRTSARLLLVLSSSRWREIPVVIVQVDGGKFFCVVFLHWHVEVD